MKEAVNSEISRHASLCILVEQLLEWNPSLYINFINY
jgi:hypothetical protein